VVWLNEMGLDLTLLRVQAYRVFDAQTVVTVSQLFPIPDVEEFTVSPQRAQAQAVEDRRRRTREQSTVVKLVRSKALADGTPLTLRCTTEVSPDVRAQIDAWILEDPDRGRATWHNHRRGPLEWAVDGERYRPTALVSKIMAEAAGLERSVRGPAWWTVPDGRDLPTVAGSTASGAGFDWGSLHSLLAAIPIGRWTTYGDPAEVVGTAAQPLGQHITSCNECPNAHRVLGVNGRPRPGFRWSDPTDARAVEDVLLAEGVPMASGTADQTARLTADELANLAGNGA
jgi:alkylated DNA nucleotide flippase Atl1